MSNGTSRKLWLMSSINENPPAKFTSTDSDLDHCSAIQPFTPLVARNSICARSTVLKLYRLRLVESSSAVQIGLFQLGLVEDQAHILVCSSVGQVSLLWTEMPFVACCTCRELGNEQSSAPAQGTSINTPRGTAVETS